MRSLYLLLLVTLLFVKSASAQSPEQFGVTTLTPPVLDLNPSPIYSARMRIWQGIPSIERTAKGRLWVTWHGGPWMEGLHGDQNYGILATSNDDGKTWSKPIAVCDPKLFFNGHVIDPHLWIDPKGRMWWFINRDMPTKDPNGTLSVWGFSTDDPDSEHPKWNAPVFAGYGSALNKPLALSNGDWIRPTDTFDKGDPVRMRFFISRDQGKSFSLLSKTGVKDGSYSEQMLVERKDGSVTCLSRTMYGISQIDSNDSGKTWQNDHQFTTERGVNARFHFRRLKSGNLLLVLNDHPKARNNMTAMLSEDEGKTWPHKLMLDDRTRVTYPDATEGSNGFVYIAYDCGRYVKGRQEIMLAKITEADIKAGKLVNKESRLGQLINRLSDEGGGVRVTDETKAMRKEFEKQNGKQEAVE